MTHWRRHEEMRLSPWKLCPVCGCKSRYLPKPDLFISHDWKAYKDGCETCGKPHAAPKEER